MTAATVAVTLPCTDRLDVWDALFEDEDSEAQAAARRTAVTLCAGCPRPCPEQITEASAPRTVTELAEDWLPPSREGRSLYTGKEKWHGTAAGVPTHGCYCHRCAAAYDAHRDRHAQRAKGHSLSIGRSCVPVADRVRVWATEAVAQTRLGLTPAQIATRLYVTEQTAEQLLAYAAREFIHA
ncbi:hypothetical protein [Streptomyces javensis]|uniref:4Fe-4S Wbl-type domain-containing protein n=1 Tax=Streptomyces javensis TaxID=114698 RepID=A0ABS0RBH1_9ACTN|nr:hypothetical protein [Streptomyces javensis]MBI0314736.1 hypothetical protein [Streptomyces javensis]